MRKIAARLAGTMILAASVTSVLAACQGGSEDTLVGLRPTTGDRDVAASGDPAGASASGTKPREACGNHLDDDHNGLADEGCTCEVEGATASCWTGSPRKRNANGCTDGVQKCQRTGEFLTWGFCTGGNYTCPGACEGAGARCACDENGDGCLPGQDGGGASGSGGGGPSPGGGSSGGGGPGGSSGAADAGGGGPQFFCSALTFCCGIVGAEVRGACEAIATSNKELECAGGLAKYGCSAGGSGTSSSSNGGTGSSGASGSGTCSSGFTCVPGAWRWCDEATYCNWGKQQCSPSGRWGTCREERNVPMGCQPGQYDQECCVATGQCCEQFRGGWSIDWTGQKPSIGACGGIACAP